MFCLSASEAILGTLMYECASHSGHGNYLIKIAPLDVALVLERCSLEIMYSSAYHWSACALA